jgi:hypothetical protein
MRVPILDQIEFGLERGLLITIALVIIIITLVMVVKAVLTVIEIVKTTKHEETEEITTSDSFKDNFFDNVIKEDIAHLDISLSDAAKNLISTYRN